MARPGKLTLTILDKYHTDRNWPVFNLTGGHAQRAIRWIDAILHSDHDVSGQEAGVIETAEMRIEWAFDVKEGEEKASEVITG